MITAIDPQAVRAQSNDKKTSALPGVGFSDVLAGASSPTATAVGLEYGYQPAAVTQAAISGMAAAPGTLSGNSLPPGGLGYDYAAPGYNPSYAAGATGPYGSLYGSTGVSGAGNFDLYGNPVSGTGTPSQDYLEKQALFTQMNDANWEMLVAQVTVNEISRDWQARSNILKTKSDTELNAVRNMRT